MLFNNTFLCKSGNIFGSIWKFFKISIFVFGQKQGMTKKRLVWPVNVTSLHSKIILSPADKII